MRIAVVQQKATGDCDANVRRGAAALEEAAAHGAVLVVYPELAFQPFFPQRGRAEQPAPRSEPVPGPATDLFSGLARKLGVVVVLNLYETDGERTFDSSPVIDADGRLLGVTRMVHIINAPCFRETDFYHSGDHGAPVYETRAGRLGVAICYDRHFPEYTRALGIKKADIMVVPQAGSVGEWPPGVFEAELQVASFQNGFFAALANRVGKEECLEFAGESFITDPLGRVIARAPAGRESILYADLDFSLLQESAARRHFLRDRRPDAYPL